MTDTLHARLAALLVLTVLACGCGSANREYTYVIERAQGPTIRVRGISVMMVAGGCAKVFTNSGALSVTTAAIVCGGVNTVHIEDPK